ncbi:MAG: hypothetical protein BRD55_11455 [Bacteroidetes bacterium SW_9_63_38]|nr:MAG: hypothetical protein BRD55_11455 [Bacteroidetes bacterium SW_9_63_38]
MTPSPSTVPLLRSLLGSVVLLGCILVVNACSSSKSTTKKTSASTRTLKLTALDSSEGTPLDSARTIFRTVDAGTSGTSAADDTMKTDSAGTFVLRNVEPALYLLDVGGYGYHTQRHVSVLIEPDDSITTTNIPLLQKVLSINCQGSRPFNWGKMTSQYKSDSSKVQVQLIDVFASDGEVRIQPVTVNDLPTTTLFFPDNYGKLGHFEVQLYDGNNDPLPYEHKNAPPDEGHRIYTKDNILPVVPQAAERLQPTTLVVGDSVSTGTTIYARMRYTFSINDTLRATSETTFPDLDLDSLQVPVFDTLRTAGAVRVPDSLVLQRDTTKMRITGIDTAVTRSGYTLFSTLRDGNAASSPTEAKNMLYIPDSVKVRAQRDSLRARVRADRSVPDVDTVAIDGPEKTFHVVDRTDRTRVDSLILDDSLVNALGRGLPTGEIPIDSLLSLSTFVRKSYLEDAPALSRVEMRRGINAIPDTTLQDSLLLTAPVADSLFHLFSPDSLAIRDTLTASTMLGNSTIADTAFVDTSFADTSLAAAGLPRPSRPQQAKLDSAAADTAAADTAIADTTRRPRPNPFLAGSFDLLAPDSDSIALDSLRLTVSPEADSVVTDVVPDEYLQDPPAQTYWHVPDSTSLYRTQVMVVDSSFFHLRARARADTSTTTKIAGLLPSRLGKRTDITRRTFPQQVIQTPAGTYRRRYLKAWEGLQSNQLKQNYCRIFPFPLRSNWRSTSMR